MNKHAEIIVVGGGIIGCAIAYFLRKAGKDVLLIERDDLGSHAPGAVAGLVAPLGPLAGPGPFADLIFTCFLLCWPNRKTSLESLLGLPVLARCWCYATRNGWPTCTRGCASGSRWDCTCPGSPASRSARLNLFWRRRSAPLFLLLRKPNSLLPISSRRLQRLPARWEQPCSPSRSHRSAGGKDAMPRCANTRRGSLHQ